MALIKDPPDALGLLREAVADRYVVERLVGRGGMANVYQARRIVDGRRVAIKLFHQHLATNIGVRRFVSEVDVTRRLTHPNIVQFIEAGEARDIPYMVLGYVDADTLRARLLRDGSLSLGDAVAICEDIVDALECAHALPVVHRDIKPENVFLGEDGVVVADFGIAKALAPDAERLTSTGATIGTPGYMSPEQGSGDKDIDRRSDIYSLGCVLYEMLAGEPVFIAADQRSLILKHVSQPPPLVRVLRPNLPEAVERVLQKSLAKSRADRYSTAREFMTDLQMASAEADRLPIVRVWRLAAGAGVAAALLYGVGQVAGPISPSNTPLDTNSIVILPFVRQDDTPELNEVQLLSDAVARWSGPKVVDPLRVSEVLSRSDSTSSRLHGRIARRLGAGRYVQGSVSSIGNDSVRVEARVYDVEHDSVLASAILRLSSRLADRDARFARFADQLLLRELYPEDGQAYVGTTSLAARQAYARGRLAMKAWDLAGAEAAFAAAIAGDDYGSGDPDYAQAHLALALSRAWRGQEPRQWHLNAIRATELESRLSPLDGSVARTLVAQSLGDGNTCDRWARMAQGDTGNAVLWFGTAHCLRYDSVVVSDPKSPSGWRFRSGYAAALRAYRRAFELRPAILISFRANGYQTARSIVESVSRLRRATTGPPIHRQFLSRAVLSGDSVLFLPYPIEQVAGGEPWHPDSVAHAIRWARTFFRDIAVSWVSTFPQSSEAMEALAVSLEVLGNQGALDTLRRAHALARTEVDSVRLAAAEAWLLVKLGIPDGGDRLASAVRLADSLLVSGGATTAAHARLLAPLAALRGRPVLAASFARQAAAEDPRVPPTMAGSAPALSVFAAVGGPPDSLRRLQAEVLRALADPRTPQGDAPRLQWLARPATLAGPELRAAAPVASLRGKGNKLLDAQLAQASGDSTLVRALIAEFRSSRVRVSPAELSIDVLFPEAELILGTEGVGPAIAWLAPLLDALKETPPQMFSDPVRAGTLVRAVMLRARLAARLGDKGDAARWARVAETLWSGADPVLVPQIHEMRELTTKSRL